MSFIEVEGLNSASNSEGIHQILKGSPICIVADTPSSDDFKTRKPFSGTAGQILGQCLGTAGLNLSAMSILFINSRSTSMAGLWTEKTGFTADGYDGVNEVIQQIKEINPNVVVPLGEVAFQALCRKKGINKYRNSMLETCGELLRADGTHYKAIPTLDPWMATRQYLYRYHIANDFRRIYEESLYPELNIPNRKILVQPSFVEAVAFLSDLIENRRPAGFDIEVFKGEVSCISFAPDAFLAMSIPFDERWTYEEEIELWRLIERYLGDPEIPKYLQNAMFDRWFLLMQKLPIITRGIIHDTMIKCFLNYPDFPKGLGFICSVFTREPYYKDDGKTWFNDLKGNGHNNINQFYEYNAKDSAVLMEADPGLSKELVQFGNAQAYDFARRLMEPLLYMATRGIKVNKEKLAEHKKEATRQQIETQKKLDEMCGMPLNVCAPKQVQNYFYNIKGYKPITSPKKDKFGNRVMKVTTDNKAMKKLAVRGSKEAVLVQQVRALRKLIGTYLNITFDADGRLRCSWNIAGTNTGRLSSSSTIFDTGTNMQNLPKVFKAFLEADDGYLMCEMDKAQAEWVVVAYLCGDANMIRTIENREDAHINTAHLMFGAPKELIKFEDELLGSESDEAIILAKRKEHCPEILKYHPIANMSMRQSGKKSNHGLNYDLGANGFAATYGMELREAKRCTDLYHRAYPSIRIWHAHIRTQLGKDRTLTNLFGRKRRFLDRWGDDLFKAAYAYIPQSTVAQLLNKGLIDVYEKQTEPEFLFLRLLELLSQVHDSVLFQRLLNDLRAYAQCILAIKGFLEVPLVANGRSFVIRTDAKVGFDAKNLEKVDIEGDLDTVTANLEAVVAKLLKKREEQTAPQIDLNDAMEDLDDDEGEE